MRSQQRGSALLLVIIVMATLFAILGLSLERSSTLFTQIHKHNLETTALNLAEAGVEYTIHNLLYSKDPYKGAANITLETGSFFTSVSRLTSSGTIEIVSTGTVKGSGTEAVVKTLRVVIQISRERPEHPLAILSREEVF